jgi:hypothetical protein
MRSEADLMATAMIDLCDASRGLEELRKRKEKEYGRNPQDAANARMLLAFTRAHAALSQAVVAMPQEAMTAMMTARRQRPETAEAVETGAAA